MSNVSCILNNTLLFHPGIQRLDKGVYCLNILHDEIFMLTQQCNFITKLMLMSGVKLIITRMSSS